ncbi:MAG: protease inhibitor I42 family protein [Ruminococcus sp.]
MKNSTKKITTIAATAIICVSTLAGATIGAGAKAVQATKAPTTSVSQAQSSKVYKINLKGNPTTAYDWSYEVSSPDVVRLVSKDYKSDPHNDGAMGVGGVYTYKFAGVKEGDVKVTFKYSSFDGYTVKKKTVTLHVDSKKNVTESKTTNISGKAYNYYGHGLTKKGYDWDYRINKKGIVDIKVQYTPNKANPWKATGTYKFTFTGKHAGNVRVNVMYMKSDNVKITETLNLHVDNNGNVTRV